MIEVGLTAYDQWASAAPDYILVTKVYTAMRACEPARGIEMMRENTD
jgi:hypothetical protein